MNRCCRMMERWQWCHNIPSLDMRPCNCYLVLCCQSKERTSLSWCTRIDRLVCMFRMMSDNRPGLSMDWHKYQVCYCMQCVTDMYMLNHLPILIQHNTSFKFTFSICQSIEIIYHLYRMWKCCTWDTLHPNVSHMCCTQRSHLWPMTQARLIELSKCWKIVWIFRGRNEFHMNQLWLLSPKNWLSFFFLNETLSIHKKLTKFI